MKVRRKKYKLKEEQPSYWPSFVDVMTTVSLTFFFIMILSMGFLTLFVDDISAKRETLYDKIQVTLDKNNVDKNIIKFNRDEGKIDIKTETFFDTGSSELKEDGVNTANIFSNIFNVLLTDKEIYNEIQYIEIVGHTDYLGTTFNNRNLSTNRAVSFLNKILPMDSEIESKFGHKFKAAGMSEFETNKTVEERNRGTEEYDKNKFVDDRKIEVKLVFSNKDLEDAVKERSKQKAISNK
ncbi:OmpA/MotB family protein [Clostridium tarantellae]|uniref:OmpA family protein n=1 Tax=Clostridium tarantellae TaxID=39493 RepID=A0A6I1MKT7_9CLOT|nr:OmpA family protein [Clostridium tarantellae]MPQ42737.1 OmpA family protein [Clostridium tarantellae]